MAHLQQKLELALVNLDKLTLRSTLDEYHFADVGQALAEFEPKEALPLISMFSLGDRAKVFSYLPPYLQADVAGLMKRHKLAALFSRMEADERADLYNDLDEEQRAMVLPGLAQAEREDLRKLSSYAEGTAGSIMTSDYATLKEHWLVSRALKQLRLEAPDKETIYQTYVIDRERRLLGTVSLRELILASPDIQVRELMRTEVVSVTVEESQEHVSKQIRHYDLLALPVVDEQQKLVGIVTYDDAMDAAVEEATEDAQKSASVGKLDETVDRVSIWELYRKRVMWLVLLVFGAMFSGAGIAHFEETISANVALVFFLPLLIGSGGNAGSQAAALMVRALATGEVDKNDWSKLFSRELLVGLALGLTMAAAVYSVGVFRGGPDVAMIVSMSMVIIVLVGSLVGLSLPFLLNKMKLDPATASGPLVATIADVSGVLVYFGLASAILGL
ncbi:MULTISPECIES: magnesium transporter [unclassified Agarivorans]|uniref:magnesium transporter n=1 Tax=unclassified Agarivorans TaxID=2636026 RepID=UPI0010F16672|nr:MULTISPECIES: magnesium transporter [unclassified Agarivorans]MDO6686667.1 magnesium transporter [Agarivorans sp. 3_MG-2023]MDO6716603.1 magnesium transporter [Agarivorans sp. 2_MG-2023]MDO6765541.1 magnesium transporter [Agarivorans sp. 1_MG-2023]GDY26628.1 magnesium transporter MgtE [Agarivorans sp. Toyoura001]